MFQFTSKAKTFAYILLVVGLLSWVAGFFLNGSTSHEQSADHHATVAYAAAGDPHSAEAHAAGAAAHAQETAHHQQENRPWAALLVNSFFFMAIALGTLFFLAIQYAAQAGWAVGLTRVMEAISLFMPIPIIVIIILVILGQFQMHHLWHWMDPALYDKASPHYDELIAGKRAYLNFGFFMVRALIYLIGWTMAARWIRKNSLREDEHGGLDYYNKNFKIAAAFLVFFGVTSSTVSWDFIMSIDTHWFSTLFGWYTFAGIFVTALAVLSLLTVFLRNGGYLPWINENHIQDLGKFMFAFSIFWTYLWFSQYMLIWYSNIPEEVTYYMQRFGQYKLWFFIMVALNFVFPVLLVMSRDSKRTNGLVVFTAIFVLIGHWLDHYIMIMPGTVGSFYGFGLAEIGPFLFFLGAFILVVFSNLAKAPLAQKNHPHFIESNHFHQ